MDNTTTLSTGKKYIKEIFSPEQFFNIPEYQRPYVWGDEQISALLDDISSAMENDSNKEYFLGCMVWNTRNYQTEASVRYIYQDILDGQQRFITLYLLHGVIRDIAQEEKLRENVQRRLIQEADEYNNIPARIRIEFEIRDDKEFLHEYILKPNGTQRHAKLDSIAADSNQTASVRNMARGILTMAQWWANKLADKTDREEKYIGDFYKYLSNKVLALYLATPNNLDDAYNLFTVLNSRGLQLQVSDILRAQNLRVIDNDTLRKAYANKWSDFENTISNPYKAFDDFLWALVFIRMKYRSDDNQSLTKAFEFMFRKNLLRKGPETLDFVEKYVEHYEALTNGSIVTREGSQLFGNIITILSSVFGSQFLTPLMYFRECFGEHQITDFLIKLDNLYSVGWLLGRRQSSTRTFIILRRIEHYYNLYQENQLSIEAAAEGLINNECMSYSFYDENISSEKPIDLSEFATLLENERWGSYAGTRVNKIRYLLLKLDLLIASPSTIIQYNKDTSSIEHLLPQKIDNTTWDIDGTEHKEWVHRIGNLVLIDKNKNASLSNKPYEIKKHKYEGAIESRANTNFVFMKHQDWHLEDLKLNNKRCVDLLMQYYEGNSLRAFQAIKRNQN